MIATSPKLIATEISEHDYAKGNQFTQDRRLLVEFGTDHRGKPLIEFNTFLGYNASMSPAAATELAAMVLWAAERADSPEFQGAHIALAAVRR